jgi:alkanesulfonate monooxygenase SsuD/methylene tetrahydromethanopterin reductase-like flavin-dependent oxidoreductase (luciferase family)
MCHPDFYLPLAIACEEVGFDTSRCPTASATRGVGQQVSVQPRGTREFLEGVPFLEPFTLVPAMGAVTTQAPLLDLGVQARDPPARDRGEAARVGRGAHEEPLHVRCRISPWPDDFAACQIPWEKRGQRMDEMIEIVRGLLTGEYFGYQGEIFQMDPIRILPGA